MAKELLSSQGDLISPETYRDRLAFYLAPNCSKQDVVKAYQAGRELYLILTSRYRAFVGLNRNPNLVLNLGERTAVIKWDGDSSVGRSKDIMAVLGLPEDQNEKLPVFLETIRAGFVDFIENRAETGRIN